MTPGGRILYQIATFVLWVFALPLFRLSATGRGRVPRRGPLVVAANHISHLDPPLLGINVPRPVHNMAKKELFKLAFLDWFMRSIGTILVNRGQGQQAIADALDMLRAGECIVIFPEGTRSKSGVLSKGHSGAIVLAIKANCPLVPSAIVGSERAMTKGSFLIKPCKVTVHFGEPYTIEYSGDRERIPREVLDRECYKLMERIEALLPAHMRPSLDQKREWYGALVGGQTQAV